MEDEFNELKNMLKSTKRPVLSDDEKKSLWGRIVYSYRLLQTKKNMQNMQNSNTSFIRIFSYSRQFVALTLVILVLAGSGITVALADTSKPGDFLFPVDRATENIRIAIASDKKKDKLRIKFSQERVEEIKILLASTDTDLAKILDGDSSKDEQKTVANESAVMDSTSTSSTESSVSEERDENNTERSFTSVESKSVQKAEDGLTFALDYIKKQQERMKANGNTEAALILEGILGELSSLANDHINILEKVKVKISDKDGSSKINIAASTDKIKTRFKFEENDEGGLSIQFESFPNKKKDRDRDHDEDDDIDDNDEDDGDKDHNKDKRKTKICHEGRTIKVSVNSLNEHIQNHGDTIGKCDDGDENHDEDDDIDDDSDDGDGDDNIDTQVPVLSNISIQKTTTTADISFTTNENTTGTLWYATQTPVDISSAQSKQTTGEANTSHTLNITNLSASTTYYVIIVVKDASGNIATSSEQSFITNATADVQAPIISSLTGSNLASTTATISWSTDEAATGKLWFDTSTPLNVTTSPDQNSGTFTTSHSFDLTSLATSTTYYYIVSSADTAGNTATSSEHSLTTL